MSESEILSKVIRLTSEILRLSTEDIKAEFRLHEDIGADALDMIEIIMALEEEFDVDISDQDEDDCRTVQDLVDLIATLLSGKEPA